MPLLAHAIRVARDASRVGRVFVSTDDAAIAAAAHDHGAGVVERPAELAGDEATSESALLHALDALDVHDGLLVFLQCTAPLTLPEDIDGTVDALLAADADSALSVAPSHDFLWRRDRDGRALAVDHDASERPRRQDREPRFVETGAVYVVRVAGFREAGHRFFGDTAMHVTPRERHLEVDDLLDLTRAQLAFETRDRESRVERLPDRPAALVLDFDGVLTDNTVVVGQDGTESVRCSRGDGMGIERVRKAGVRVAVLSKERNPVVSVRCEKLGVTCVQGLEDKWTALRGWLAEGGVDAADTVYVGNDLNDAECLREVGCGVAVRDAHPEVRRLARFVTDRPGGHGAVREVTDLIEARLDNP